MVFGSEEEAIVLWNAIGFLVVPSWEESNEMRLTGVLNAMRLIDGLARARKDM